MPGPQTAEEAALRQADLQASLYMYEYHNSVVVFLGGRVVFLVLMTLLMMYYFYQGKICMQGNAQISSVLLAKC